MASFVVRPEHPRDRLDKCVAEALRGDLPYISRAAVQRWISDGLVLVDGGLLSSKARVSLGARVEVTVTPEPPSEALPDASVVFAVVYEDADLLVVDKPAHLVVHPARGHRDKTLVNGLLALGLDPAALEDGEANHQRPGIVHRIDKGTSGLLVVAKNAATREALKKLFAAHEIEREYLAVVVGQARTASFDTAHGRHPSDRLRFSASTRAKDAKRAITHVTLLEQLGPLAVVACRLETGRTHQIRVHLSEQMKTPVFGDALYGGIPREPALRAAALELGRQALHARILGFQHPTTGRAARWESSPPPDLDRLLSWARRRLGEGA